MVSAAAAAAAAAAVVVDVVVAAAAVAVAGVVVAAAALYHKNIEDLQALDHDPEVVHTAVAAAVVVVGVLLQCWV